MSWIVPSIVLTVRVACGLRRDDPDIDETTRLRNRIAELESLVRELRGAFSSVVESSVSNVLSSAFSDARYMLPEIKT